MEQKRVLNYTLNIYVGRYLKCKMPFACISMQSNNKSRLRVRVAKPYEIQVKCCLYNRFCFSLFLTQQQDFVLHEFLFVLTSCSLLVVVTRIVQCF